MTCAFFGHKEAPDSIRPILEKKVRSVIENDGCREFLIGNQGHFDAMAYSVLKGIRRDCPSVRVCVVLAYLPCERREYAVLDYADTIYPEGLELVPRRFAISHRNRWMVENSDAIICYVNHSGGGAYQAVHLAEKRKLQIINLA